MNFPFWRAVQMMQEEGRKVRVVEGSNYLGAIVKIVNGKLMVKQIGENAYWGRWRLESDGLFETKFELVEEPMPVKRLKVFAIPPFTNAACWSINAADVMLEGRFPLKVDPSTNECYVEVTE